MKFCPGCATSKSAEAFYRNKAKKDGRSSYCKVCFEAQALVMRDYKRKQYLKYLATHPCVDCGERDPVVLESDHEGKKAYPISRLLNGNSTWAFLLKELEKCKIRCANCHRKRTAKQFGSYRMVA